MEHETRTPLGELLATLRKQRGLSQKELERRTVEYSMREAAAGAVSRRTIAALEQPLKAGKSRRRPRFDTVHSLAVALGLDVDSPGYRAFMEAAQHPVIDPSSTHNDSDEPALTIVEAGREQILHRLAGALDAAAGGTPSAVLVRGDPGMGKSTLIAHACRHALVRHAGAVVLWGQARPGDPSHGALRRIIRQMLGDIAPSQLGDALPPALLEATPSRAEVAARALAKEGPLLVATALTTEDRERPIVTHVPDRQVAHRLAHLASATPDDSMRAVSGCEQFFRVIRRYAAAGPVVMVIDDLHEADPATIASLDHLLNRIHQRNDMPIAVVAASIPERQLDGGSAELKHFVETVQRLFPHGTIDLAPTLAAPAARPFADAMLERASLPTDPATVNALIDRTGGNPRYIAGIIEALHEEGAEHSDITAWIETTIPPVLADSLVARVGRLPEELQRILTDASILGHDFHAETLMRMLDLSLERFIELVDRHIWRRHGLLRAGGTDVIGGRVMHTYRFQPSLLRDAIYRGLSDLERTHAHGRAADALIELYGDTQHGRLDRLAHHLERAGRHEEAARTYLRAGELARRDRQLDTAQRLLEQAIALEPRVNDPELRIRTLINLGLCARGAGEPHAARTHLTRALDLASSWHDDTVLASALEAMGMVDFDAGAMAQGRDRILRAVDIWAAHDAPDTSRSLANLSYILYGLGRYDEAIDSAERARAEATRTRQTTWWIDGTFGLAACWMDLGRYDRAADLYEHALLIGTEIGDRHRQRISWVNLALVAIERRDWDAAEHAMDQVDLEGDAMSGVMKGIVAFHRGLIAEGSGDGTVAREHFRRARELRDSQEQEALAIDAAAGELRIALADGSPEEASALLDDLERRLDERGNDGIDGVEHPGRLYETLIEAALALGRTDEARHHARAAIGYLTERSTHVPEIDRESYLSGVSSHRRILELGATLGLVAG